MDLFDSHCHLDAEEFDPDRAIVIARAKAAGVRRQLLPAVTAASWSKLRDVCAAAEGLYPAYGLHPMFLSEHRGAHVEELHGWIERERPRAIGECGLDYFVEGLDRALQSRFFDAQLALAREFGLPVVVHARRAVDDVIAAIRRANGVRGVVHSFSGSAEQARQLAQLGFLVGFGGPVTYPRAKRLHRLAATLPIDTLLLETDAPDQPDVDHRGQRNEPARLLRVLDAIAKLRDMDPGDLARATTCNAEQLFGFGSATAD